LHPISELHSSCKKIEFYFQYNNNFKFKVKMKKFFMTLVAAVAVAASANAQVYVGGGIGIGSTKVDAEGAEAVTSYKLIPEVGYNFNDKWAAGVAFGWKGVNKGGARSVFVNPYARYTFVKFNHVNVFVDGGVAYEHDNNQTLEGVYAKSANALSVGFRPGVAVNLNDKVSFVAHVGFFGYTHLKIRDGIANGFAIKDMKVNSWNADVDGNNITFGVYYNF
jgi:hypothetical protein